MALTVYGIARSRAIRVLWLLKELGAQYTHVEMGFGPEGSGSAEFRRINPNGQVPVIDDDGVVLSESLAINLYLAKKFGGPLAPADLGEDGRMTMWALWSVLEIEAQAAPIMYNTSFYPPEQRNPAVVEAAIARLQAPLAVLEAHLSAHGHLVGGRFTVADLNLIGCLFYLRFTPQVLAERPATLAYYQAGLARPGARAAFALRGE